jgi:hypothetical protein
MKKLTVPKFANEREEAEWWDAHMGAVEGNLYEAIRTGQAKVLTREALAQRVKRAESKRQRSRKAS